MTWHRTSPWRRPLALPFGLWPGPDRAAWARNLAPRSVLDEAARWAHWADPTEASMRRCYGRWLDHLALHDPAALALPPGWRVTPERVRRYLAALPNRLSPATRASLINGLLIAVRGLAPRRDLDWLQAVVTRLKARAEAVSIGEAGIAHPRQLYRIGCELMASAQRGTLPTNHRPALVFRDGLIIALLAARPLRLRSMATLAPGTSVLVSGKAVRILLRPELNKTGRILEWRLPAPLAEAMLTYLAQYRPLLQPDPPLDALWLSEQRRALSAAGIRAIVMKHTRTRLGAAICPHRFRTAAFTAIALDDPEHVTTGVVLLGHSRIETGERHYNLARTDQAVRRHGEVVGEARGTMRIARLLDARMRERARELMLRFNRKRPSR
jgi:integrase/recombinase XerD